MDREQRVFEAVVARSWIVDRGARERTYGTVAHHGDLALFLSHSCVCVRWLS